MKAWVRIPVLMNVTTCHWSSLPDGGCVEEKKSFKVSNPYDFNNCWQISETVNFMVRHLINALRKLREGENNK